MKFNFEWYCGKQKKKRKQNPKYQHEYYLRVTKPKRQKERQIKMNEEQKREVEE